MMISRQRFTAFLPEASTLSGSISSRVNKPSKIAAVRYERAALNLIITALPEDNP
jgi:hypothetical protein